MNAGPRQPSGHAPSVLVIDDEPILARTVARFLERHGCAVTVCHDGPSGLDQFQAGRFDVVITDLELPGVDGNALVRELNDRRHPPRIIVISAHVAGDDTLSIYNSLSVYYLQKPFNLDELLPLVLGPLPPVARA